VNTPLISLKNVSLTKQDKDIIKNYSVDISESEIINFYGENGCGKTSLLKLVTKLSKPTEGEILFHSDLDISDDIFYVGHKYGLKNELTVLQNLEYAMSFSSKKKISSIISELESYAMQSLSNLQVKYLSHGQKKIISMIQLTISYFKVWILDEPFTGLDQDKASILFEKMQNHINDNGTVIITSHSPKNKFKNIELC